MVLVSYFFVLSPPRRTVLVLVLDGLHRLASNTIIEVLESLGSRDIYRIDRHALSCQRNQSIDPSGRIISRRACSRAVWSTVCPSGE